MLNGYEFILDMMQMSNTGSKLKASDSSNLNMLKVS